MALSGSTDFSMTAIDLLKASFRAAGVLNAGGTLTANDTVDGIEALNLVLKALIPHGLKLWQMREKAVTLVAGQDSYTLGPAGADVTMDRPHDITSAFLRDTNSVDHHITKYSRDEYRAINTKSATGKPTIFYYDKQLTSGEVFLWNVPTATEAAEYTLYLNYRKPIDDIDTSTDDIEVPPEWYNAIKWTLAHDLGIEYDTPDKRMQRIERNAKKYLDLAMQGDTDIDTSIYFEAGE